MGYFTIFLAGLMIGYLGVRIVDSELPRMQAKYSVGTCLSNGLYFEKVREIQVNRVLRYKYYVLDATINGKKEAPSTSPSWIVDNDYVVVDSRNCL